MVIMIEKLKVRPLHFSLYFFLVMSWMSADMRRMLIILHFLFLCMLKMAASNKLGKTRGNILGSPRTSLFAINSFNYVYLSIHLYV